MAIVRSLYWLAASAPLLVVQGEITASAETLFLVERPAAQRRMAPAKNCTEWDGCKFEGLILPLFGEAEMEWPNVVRIVLYLMGLSWTFLGIAIISDVFMAGIEKVTSWKKRVKDKKTGRTVTVYVWNPTVANLTLMALGSSAPEILLSLIEITSDEMFLGELGAGTIVGSAAFNLLVISAVCVLAIEEPEVRYIQQTTVYMITASASVLAYLWLVVILMFISPNVCEAWEGVLTLLFMPLLVVLAYFADKGYFDKKKPEEEAEPLQTIPDDVTPDELAQIRQQILETHGAGLTDDQVVQIMAAKYFTVRSRAYYRTAAMKKTIHGQKRQSMAVAGPPDLQVSQAIDTTDQVATDKAAADKATNKVVIGFECARYAFLEDCGHAQLILVRTGVTNCKATVHYKTRDGTATVADQDYAPQEGEFVFEKDEVRKTLSIQIHDDNAYEENEEFYVDLSAPKAEDGAECGAKLSEFDSVIVVIIDDDDPGVLKFKQEEVEVIEGAEETTAEVIVERIGGASGTISCSYSTEDMNAVGGMDYEATSGKLELGQAVQSFTIQVPIKPKGRYEKTSSFIVRLTDPTGCKFDADTDGGEECCIAHVTIKGKTDQSSLNVLQRMESKINSQTAILGHRHWKEQFYDALFKVIDDDDEDDDDEADKEPPTPTKFDYFMHIAALPWKILFAFVPPVDYCGGWCCFFGALVMIAVVTAIVGDIANLVGCVLNIEAEITAITFVALGTSLPDTFASQTAAKMDPYADASIGNVTGSNSVNVFLGLGISWTMAAFYWEFFVDPTDEWLRRVGPGGQYSDVVDDIDAIRKDGKAVFVVPAGTLWFNLMVFSVNALFAIQHLFARRKKWGGELGGPRTWAPFGQKFSAAFLLFQWVLYIGASSIWATIQNACEEV